MIVKMVSNDGLSVLWVIDKEIVKEFVEIILKDVWEMVDDWFVCWLVYIIICGDFLFELLFLSGSSIY